jgi:hypothetical protein
MSLGEMSFLGFRGNVIRGKAIRGKVVRENIVRGIDVDPK